MLIQQGRFPRLSPLQKKALAVVASLALWVVLSWLDLAMGLKVRIGPAYAIPVLLAAWYLGRRWGLLAAVVSAGLWHGMQMAVLHEFTITFYRYWDLLSGLIGFSAIAVAASWSKGLYNREVELNEELQQAIEKVQTLEGMLPICAWCRKVRDDHGFWEQLESYVAKHSDTTWTHGICPDCEKKFKEHGFG